MFLLYTVVAAQIYKKKKYVLEPLHIFELNTLANFSLLFLNNVLVSMNVLCAISQWIQFYASLNVYTGLILSQVDRFLAIYWDASYKNKMTPGLAKGSLKVEDGTYPSLSPQPSATKFIKINWFYYLFPLTTFPFRGSCWSAGYSS